MLRLKRLRLGGGAATKTTCWSLLPWGVSAEAASATDGACRTAGTPAAMLNRDPGRVEGRKNISSVANKRRGKGKTCRDTSDRSYERYGIITLQRWPWRQCELSFEQHTILLRARS
jgi:hypothetical protein